MSDTTNKKTASASPPKRQRHRKPVYYLYRVYFREEGQITTCYSKIPKLAINEVVMLQTNHGLEPATVFKIGLELPADYFETPPSNNIIIRRATADEKNKFTNLINKEKEAFALCNEKIKELDLKMKLISVERYFNGSKIIFYFTAENRVDFRELVKSLVQEFRTRVEMKQIGVRHETKMIGGLGCCGRELCCSSFIGKFAPVSIKMAKEQDLPLNPVKISGVCNRLLCCLTHEHQTYKELRKGMPAPGRTIRFDGRSFKVIQNNVLMQTITVVSPDEDGLVTLEKDQWAKASVESKLKSQSSGKKRGGKKSKPKKGKDNNKQSKRDKTTKQKKS